jgi:hypothetical protein
MYIMQLLNHTPLLSIAFCSLPGPLVRFQQMHDHQHRFCGGTEDHELFVFRSARHGLCAERFPQLLLLWGATQTHGGGPQ